MTKSQREKRFRHITTLVTPRLTLRKIALSDVSDVYEYAREESVTRYLLWSPHDSEGYTFEYLQNVQAAYRRGDFYDWGIEITETKKMIGTCGFTSFDHDHNRAEVGYVLNPAFWGNGYATEALRAVIAYGFRELEIERIEAHYMAENAPSRRVMEKCAMTYEGTLKRYMLVKGAYRDIGICAVLKEDYPFYDAYQERRPLRLFPSLW